MLNRAQIIVYVKKFDNDDFIILLIYVKDMLIIRQDKSKIEKMKKKLIKSFDMKNLGLARQIFGMKISHDWKTSYRRFWKCSICISPRKLVLLLRVILVRVSR